MSIESILEALALALSLGIWLGPLARSLRLGRLSLLHPCGLFCAFIGFTQAVALSEHWFGWSQRWSDAGLRLQTAVRQPGGMFYVVPLAIAALAGLAYHFGVYAATGSVVPRKIDNPNRFRQYPVFGRARKSDVLFAACATAVLCVLPFSVFGQGPGFFWTTGLFMAANFLSVPLVVQGAGVGHLLYLCGFFLTGLMLSKGNCIYYVLPLIAVLQARLVRRLRKFDSKRVLFAVVVGAVAYYGTQLIIERRGEYTPGRTFADYILVREYGFEVFSLLVDSVPPSGQLSEGSWVLMEAIECAPHAWLSNDKRRAGVEVAERYMPADFRYMPTAGYYRWFLFGPYHDFGVAGAVIFAGLFGFAAGRLYAKARRSTVKHQSLWPMLAYSPIPVYAQFYANGTVAFALIYTAFASATIFLLAKIISRSVAVRFAPAGIRQNKGLTPWGSRNFGCSTTAVPRTGPAALRG